MAEYSEKCKLQVLYSLLVTVFQKHRTRNTWSLFQFASFPLLSSVKIFSTFCILSSRRRHAHHNINNEQSDLFSSILNTLWYDWFSTSLFFFVYRNYSHNIKYTCTENNETYPSRLTHVCRSSAFTSRSQKVRPDIIISSSVVHLIKTGYTHSRWGR